MNEKPKLNATKGVTSLSHQIGVKADRKLKAKRNANQHIWFGLGMMGLIGWSVVVPTLLGAAFGFWLDKHHSESYSWTLMFLLIGLVLGCLNAWHWVSREDTKIHEEQEDTHE